MSSTLKVDQIKENQNMEHKVYQLFYRRHVATSFLYVNIFHDVLATPD